MPKFMLDGQEYCGGSGSETVVELTQEEYDALGDVVNSDNKTYYITDADDQYDAGSVIFDNSENGMDANNVQDAISELNKNFKDIIKITCTTITQNFPVGYTSVQSTYSVGDGYKAYCISGCTNTITDIDIISVNGDGSIRVWNRTTSEREVKITFWWIVFKVF